MFRVKKIWKGVKSTFIPRKHFIIVIKYLSYDINVLGIFIFEKKNNSKKFNFSGREAAKKQIKEAKAKLKANKQKVIMSTEDFRASQSQKLKSRKVESDLFRAQKACRQLDMSKEFTEPVEVWFWPKTITEATESLDNENEAQIQEILEENIEEEEEEIEFPPDEMLVVITQYLRTEHLYCIWCGITFNDSEDLQNSCPGNSRDDHDD